MSSTHSPPNSPDLPMAIASRIPPELLLDIFSFVSDSPHMDLKRFLDRNRNMKSLALVHSAWQGSAQQILQEEVFIPGPKYVEASDKEVQRIAMLLLDSKLKGTKYLTVDGHLNELIANTGYAMWSQIRYVNLLTSCRNDGTTWMSDFTPFPRLQDLHLDRYHDIENYLCFDSSDVHLHFAQLRRITFRSGISSGGLSHPEDIDDARNEDLAAFLPITHKLFSPSNMPNLRHLGIQERSDPLSRTIVSLARILPQITTLVIVSARVNTSNLFPENRILDNLRVFALQISSYDASTLFNHPHRQWNLDSLHLSTRSIMGMEEVISRLIKIAKGEDSRHRMGRIVIYGDREVVETKHKDLIDDLYALEWRGSGLPIGFDGR